MLIAYANTVKSVPDVRATVSFVKSNQHFLSELQTLASLYKKGHNATKVDLPSCEVANDHVPEVVSAYYSTQLGTTFSHYEDEVNKKRKKRPVPVRAYGTRHTSTPGKAESTATPSNKRPRSDGDAEGGTNARTRIMLS